MLSTRRRTSVFRRTLKISDLELYKVAVATPISVKDPVTGKLVSSSVVTFKEEPVIDKHLSSDDFKLDVQLRNNAVLQECPAYLEPSTPEEFTAIVSRGFSNLESLKSSAKVESTPQEPTPKEPTPQEIKDE